jgi:hypothetical protein
MCLNVDLEEKFSLKKTKLSPKQFPLWRGIKGEDNPTDLHKTPTL